MLSGSTRLACVVTIYSTSTVNGIRLTQCNGSMSAVYGSNQGTVTTFTTTEDDPITYINGWAGSQIDAIQFTTLSGVQSPLIGEAGGNTFSDHLGQGLVSFKGYETLYTQIYSLQFEYRCENCVSDLYGTNRADGFDTGFDGLRGLICNITVFAEASVFGLQLTSCNGTVSPLYGPNVTASGPITPATFSTDASDPIVIVTVRAGFYIDGIQFQTKSGVSSPFYGSSTGGTPYTVFLGEGLVGMLGFETSIQDVNFDRIYGVQFSFICATTSAPTLAPSQAPTSQPSLAPTRIPTPQPTPGQQVIGPYTLYSFTDPVTSTIIFPNDVFAEVLLVAGGGGGGYGIGGIEGAGGGGAGAVGIGTLYFLANTAYTVTVGNGGAAGTVGTEGGQFGDRSKRVLATDGGFTQITGPGISEIAFGGGYGGSNIQEAGQGGGNGGSGGGGAAGWLNTGYGLATGGGIGAFTYYGNDGAPGANGGGGGAGGGACVVGESGFVPPQGGGRGGDGLTWVVTSQSYGGGGGGGGAGGDYQNTPRGPGGLGGGGDGAQFNMTAGNGTDNTGGGGGGATGGPDLLGDGTGFGGDGGRGGSGVVIVAATAPTASPSPGNVNAVQQYTSTASLVMIPP